MNCASLELQLKTTYVFTRSEKKYRSARFNEAKYFFKCLCLEINFMWVILNTISMEKD